MCGEKPLELHIYGLKLGSPPRVRGKVDNQLTASSDTRITPACAGKRPHTVCVEQGRRDHPRVCGEKIAGV